MTIVMPNFLQVVGIIGLVLLLAGTWVSRQWLGVAAALICLTSVVMHDVLLLPVQVDWLPAVLATVFAAMALTYLLRMIPRERWQTLRMPLREWMLRRS